MLPCRRIRIAGPLAALLLACAANVWQPETVRGQNATPPTSELMSVSFVDVKPELTQEFESLLMYETNPMLKKAGITWRRVWRTTRGDIYRYVVANGIENFASLDQPPPAERALGKDGAQKLWNKQAKLVDHVESMIVERRLDLSYISPMAAEPKLAIFTRVEVNAGKVAEFESIVTGEILPAMKQSGTAGYWVSRTRYGGNPNLYTTVWLMDSYAELDKGHPLDRVLGREGSAKLGAKIAATLDGPIERTLMRFVPELSFDSRTAK